MTHEGRDASRRARRDLSCPRRNCAGATSSRCSIGTDQFALPLPTCRLIAYSMPVVCVYAHGMCARCRLYFIAAPEARRATFTISARMCRCCCAAVIVQHVLRFQFIAPSSQPVPPRSHVSAALSSISTFTAVSSSRLRNYRFIAHHRCRCY